MSKKLNKIMQNIELFDVRQRAHQAQDEFGGQFFGQVVGLIEGEEEIPVVLNMLSASCSCFRSASFGVPPGELAIVVGWMPAGLQHGPRPPDGGPRPEIGVDPSKIPEKSTWITFPRKFVASDGTKYPVYYKREPIR
jgi:hypothetical protein